MWKPKSILIKAKFLERRGFVTVQLLLAIFLFSWNSFRIGRLFGPRISKERHFLKLHIPKMMGQESSKKVFILCLGPPQNTVMISSKVVIQILLVQMKKYKSKIVQICWNMNIYKFLKIKENLSLCPRIKDIGFGKMNGRSRKMEILLTSIMKK